MRLSEAIRLGAMLRPQYYGGYFGKVRINGEPVIGSCALGAAIEACDATAPERVWTNGDINTLTRYSFLLTVRPGALRPPGFSSSMWDGATVGGTIQVLNDTHHWTREQIADWVQAVEDHLNPPTETKPTETTELVAV